MDENEQSEKEQLEKDQVAALAVLSNQVPALGNQMVGIVHQLSAVGGKWPAYLLVIAGVLLLLISLAMRIWFRDAAGAPYLRPAEFIALIAASVILMTTGPLFALYQSRNWRGVIEEQQAMGMEILNKQLDISNDLIMRKHKSQPRGVVIFQTKIRKPVRY